MLYASDMETLSKEVNGFTWKYIRMGNVGKGKPLFIIHGINSNASFFTEYEDYLGEDFDIIVPHLPGFGYTDNVDDVSCEKYSELLEEFILSFNFAKIDIFGISLGGSLAIMLAQRGKVMFDKVYLNSPFNNNMRKRDDLIGRIEQKLLKLPDRYLRLAQKRVILETAFLLLFLNDRRKFDKIYKNRKVIIPELQKLDAVAEKKIYFSLTDTDFNYMLRSLHNTVVIAGDRDDVITPEANEDTSRKIILNYYVAIKDADHALSYIVPEKVSKIIKQYSLDNVLTEIEGISWFAI